jgi:REP element-mobilizing transposase RayT
MTTAVHHRTAVATDGTDGDATEDLPGFTSARQPGEVCVMGEKDYKTWGKRRGLRADGIDYRRPNAAFHVIVGSRKGRGRFRTEILNLPVIRCLEKACLDQGYDLAAYCLMPDHLHALVVAGNRPGDLREVVRRFKACTRKMTGMVLWQRGFYDHAMRREETLVTVADYILNNPVRKGLVEEWSEYAWMGGSLADMVTGDQGKGNCRRHTKTHGDATGRPREEGNCRRHR